MVLALSSTISWSKVDYYYGVSWCSSVPHSEGFTGFQGTVNWSPIGSREACTGSQGAVQWYLSAVQWSLSGTILLYMVLRCSPAPHKVLYRLSGC